MARFILDFKPQFEEKVPVRGTSGYIKKPVGKSLEKFEYVKRVLEDEIGRLDGTLIYLVDYSESIGDICEVFVGKAANYSPRKAPADWCEYLGSVNGNDSHNSSWAVEEHYIPLDKNEPDGDCKIADFGDFKTWRGGLRNLLRKGNYTLNGRKPVKWW